MGIDEYVNKVQGRGADLNALSWYQDKDEEYDCVICGETFIGPDAVMDHEFNIHGLEWD